MLPLLRALALVPLALAGRLRRIERRAIDRFHAAGANNAERAVLLEDGGALTAFVHRRLADARAIVPAGNDRYYLNQDAYDLWCRRRRRRATVALAIALIISVVLYFRGGFR
jgi:hypothetical protein